MDCYNKVFNNLFIKKEIFRHLNLFNVNYSRNFTVQEFKEFKRKDYLIQLKLQLCEDDIEKDGDLLLSLVPDNVESIVLSSKRSQHFNEDISIKLPSIPNSIKKFKTPKWFIGPFPRFSNDGLSSLKVLILGENNSLDQKLNQLPSSLEVLKIIGYFHSIEKDILPNSLKLFHVEAGGKTPLFIERNALPDSLTELKVVGFTLPFEESSFLPNNLKTISITNYDIQKVEISKHFFPSSHLENLEIVFLCDDNFDFLQTLTNLKTFKIKHHNQNISKLPKSLSTLTVNSNASNLYQLSTIGLKHLEFGYFFNALLTKDGKSILPHETIEKIEFGFLFNHEIGLKEFINCNQLKEIHFGLNFNQKLLPNILPKNLVRLSFKGFNNGDTPLINSGELFPKTLEYLKFGKFSINSLPPNLTSLELSNYLYMYDFELPSPSIMVKAKFFRNSLLRDSCFKRILNHIEYVENSYDDYNHVFTSYPKNLKVFKLYSEFKHPLETLCLKKKSKLEYLDLGFSFNQPIFKDCLPLENSIKVLVLGKCFSQKIILNWFSNLENLVIFGDPLVLLSEEDEGKEHCFGCLKYISTPINNYKFLNNLNNIFYPFLKFLKKNK
ncbi:hypothetical protein DICPUDRAFT_154693 [Dictyostelium purpureum]|uniref:Uncharacterized protein n=1 Tax=Dictyostelium purpureum TaxID=5786 RepID=F0ZS07_DICPU|nr:uncharacterized protein DICPUDRAFT_154693 [Dictyostelium purpureum]EGC33253.1 hypothetical protein DICPUDRAFT_154693 [Dictyostelium purpureum]|eukprot:XP_003290200.1 hypothetical protein DICPUDRAFT_154693 [Dictyostelium purpureum]